MYIDMQCADSNGTLTTEICTFYGIKYDSRYRSALISTEHLNHDYVVPIDPKDYEAAVKQIMAAMTAHADMINVSEGIVWRGRKGESRNVKPQKITITF